MSNNPSAAEKAYIEKTREKEVDVLLGGGAVFVESDLAGPRLEVTLEQVEEAYDEMLADPILQKIYAGEEPSAFDQLQMMELSQKAVDRAKNYFSESAERRNAEGWKAVLAFLDSNPVIMGGLISSHKLAKTMDGLIKKSNGGSLSKDIVREAAQEHFVPGTEAAFEVALPLLEAFWNKGDELKDIMSKN